MIINAATRFSAPNDYKRIPRFIDTHRLDPFVRLRKGQATLLSLCGEEGLRLVQIMEAAERAQAGAGAVIGIDLHESAENAATIYVDPVYAWHLGLPDTPATAQLDIAGSSLLVEFSGMDMANSIAESRPWGAA